MNRVFSATSDVVRVRRPARARDELTSVIAHRRGFSDTSHFSRTTARRDIEFEADGDTPRGWYRALSVADRLDRGGSPRVANPLSHRGMARGAGAKPLSSVPARAGAAAG